MRIGSNGVVASMLTGKEAQLAFLIRRYSILSSDKITCRHCLMRFDIKKYLSHIRSLSLQGYSLGSALK